MKGTFGIKPELLGKQVDYNKDNDLNDLELVYTLRDEYDTSLGRRDGGRITKGAVQYEFADVEYWKKQPHQ